MCRGPTGTLSLLDPALLQEIPVHLFRWHKHHFEESRLCKRWSDLRQLHGGVGWESSFSRLLKVPVTKEHPFRGSKATKQPRKVNRSVLVAVSLPRVVNHSVCRRGGLCCLCTIYNHFKAVGGRGEGGKEGGCCLSFSDSRSTSKSPVYDIRSSHFS